MAKPRAQERAQAIAALCTPRGLVPNSADLSAIPMLAVIREAIPLVKLLGTVSGSGPVYENSFATPDHSLWAADLWTPKDKQQWNSFSMVVFTVPGVNLPYVGVMRKGQPNTSTLTKGSPLELESIDFTARFKIRADDHRSAVMLLDQGMMQWLLDCDPVSFEMTGDRVQAVVCRSSEPAYQPGLAGGWHRPGQPDVRHTNPHRADPVELELLFKFVDGFGPRVSQLVRNEFAGNPEQMAVLDRLTSPLTQIT
jgi:hypothetical protein